MPRKSTPSFVLELALQVTPGDERRLERGVFEAAKRLSNTVLQSGLEILQAIRSDPAWEAARKMPRATSQQRKARGQAFTDVRRAHGFSDFDFQAMAVQHKNAAGYAGRLSAPVTQKLGTKVFLALEQYLLGKKGKPRFKGVKRPLHSVEGKSNETGVRWNEDDGCVYLAADWAIPAKLPDLRRDEWLWVALRAPTKYCRITWRVEHGKRRWYVQLVQEGVVPLKDTVAAKLAEVPKDAAAGLDIGPSTIAWCTEDDAGVARFCAEVDAPQRLIRTLQRKLDRQRRANNPENFAEDGTVRAWRHPWKRSGEQQKTEQQLASLQTRTAAQRAQSHGRSINNLLSKARHFRHDGVSAKALQKIYGRSISARAPGRFMSELQRKAERAGGGSSNIDVRTLKTSQYDHSSGAFVKKSLSERWHVFADGRGRCQRDVYSAFLALHVVEVVDAHGVITQRHDPVLLEEKWKTLAPLLRDKGLFVEASRSRKGRVPHDADFDGSPSCDGGLVPSSGVRARGATRAESSSSPAV